jgi:hypothetical protein
MYVFLFTSSAVPNAIKARKTALLLFSLAFGEFFNKARQQQTAVERAEASKGPLK